MKTTEYRIIAEDFRIGNFYKPTDGSGEIAIVTDDATQSMGERCRLRKAFTGYREIYYCDLGLSLVM